MPTLGKRALVIGGMFVASLTTYGMVKEYNAIALWGFLGCCGIGFLTAFMEDL